MEALTRLVTESLVRHGFDRPLDYRRLHWSRWFRCESHHSLLSVPSRPGVFAVAEEITHVAIPPSAVPRSEASADVLKTESRAPEAATPAPRRMLAVTQFFEDDDMAFVLDRMLSRENPMRARLISGRYFVRFVVVEDQVQRRSICNALNQWMSSAAEKASGIGSHFASSLELTPATEYVPLPDPAQGNLFDPMDSVRDRVPRPVEPSEARPALAGTTPSPKAPPLDSGAATNIHCPNPLPSGF